jgi:hypothetical protein
MILVNEQLEDNSFFYMFISENIEMGGACSTYGGRERCVQGSGGET